MSGYIEQESPGQYFNPVSETIEVNPPDTECCHVVCTNTDENLKRWAWLIDKWEVMTFKERMALFIPRLHYINLRNIDKENFDDTTQAEIIDKAYEYCRDFDNLKFVTDRQGIPNMMVVYKPININAIPSAEIKALVKTWAVRFGFLTSF